MKNSCINFVLTGDNNYIAPLGVCMTSILLNLAKDRCARFYVFVEGFTKDDMNRLEDVKKVRQCEIIFVNMENYTHLFSCIDTSKFVLQYVNLVVYYRLLMLDILPNDVDKCFYIDGDMIIDTDLSVLYDKFDDQNILGAVVEILAMQYKDNILKHFMEWEELESFQKCPSKSPYFNAGFFLLNVKKAKELKLFKQAFAFLERHPNPPYADQDTLNYIIGQTYPQLVQYFPPSYNVFCDMHHDINLYYDAFYDKKDIQDAFEHPKIYHYGGANKPWKNRKARFFYSIWWRYCYLSPWSDLQEPYGDILENNNLPSFDDSNIPNNSIDPNIISSTYKLFNIIPIFTKKIKFCEKKYYFCGIRILYKKQKKQYIKYYRLLGLKFKKINTQKMYEFKMEDVKNIINWNSQESRNKADWQFEELKGNLDVKLNELRNDICSQFDNLKNENKSEDDQISGELNTQKMYGINMEDIKNIINWNSQESRNKADLQFEELKENLDVKLNELRNDICFQFNNLKNENKSQDDQISGELNKQFDVFKNSIKLDYENALKNLFSFDKKFEKEIELLAKGSADTQGNFIISIEDIKKKVSIMNSVSITHQKTFLPFKNFFEGKDIVILGTGSSLNSYNPIPNAIHIGVNNAYKFEKILLDFLFIQDISGLQDVISDINEYGNGKCQKFYGDVLPLEHCAIPESYLIKYGAKRYYSGGMNTPFIRDISACLLPDYGSVIFAALAFALYTNPKKIFLVGCDCCDTGYFDKDKNTISDSLKEDLPNILRGWQNFKLFANHHYPDTDIISINPVGLKGLFHDA